MARPDDIKGMFFEECSDLMAALFEGLALLEQGMAEADTVNAVFRAVHSIKGGAGAFGLDDLVHFAHRFETVLDELRAGRLDGDPPLIQTMLRAADHLAGLLEAAQTDGPVQSDRGQALLEELSAYIAGKDEEPAGGFAFMPMMLDLGAIDVAAPEPDRLHVRFRPHAKLYFNGHDPLLLIEGLRRSATVTVAIELDRIPMLDRYDPDAPTLSFLLTVEAFGAETLLQEAFEFVDGICDLDILDPFESPPEPQAPDGSPVPDPSAPPPMADTVDAEPGLAPAPGLLHQPGPGADPASPAPARAEGSRSKPAAPGESTLRVELDKVDRLINTVGELIINHAMIAQRIDQLGLLADSALEGAMADYRLLSRELQEGVMSIRAQPVKALFQRMARITREVGDTTGKAVRLTTRGENTEVDKTVIERLVDPLTHMIRNAVDHGLERPEARMAAGKPETGEIRLTASHKSGSVVIELGDDGAGLNRERILETAIRKGLVPRTAELSDAEIDKLLFLPGFSTNTEVSKLSGRGVGMDVVKTAVQALGGRISIASTPGRGTTFTITLPLTLAVMDGIVVTVASETMIIPITAVIETLRPKPQEIHRLGKDQLLLSIRGEYVPIVDIRQKLGLLDGPPPPDQLVLILVEGVDHNRCALCVDAVQDQRQVVIKAVGGNYGPIPGVSAATILGNGKIALILDTDQLSQADRRFAIPPHPGGGAPQPHAA